MSPFFRTGLLKLTSLCLFLFAFPAPVRAASEFRPVGARSGGMGDTFVGRAEGAEGLFWNPASVVWTEGVEAVGSYEQPFGMVELETEAFGVAVSFGKGAAGVSYQDYGFSLYQEQTVGLTCGVAFSPRVGVGVTVRGIQVAVTGVGKRRWTAFDLGVRAYLTEELVWGLVAWNAGGKEVGGLGQGGAMGVGFEVAPGVSLLVDVQKEAGMPVGMSAGMEYRAGKRVALRTGAGGGPERLSLGVGLQRGALGVDYAAVYHTVMGLSHRVSLTVGRR